MVFAQFARGVRITGVLIAWSRVAHLNVLQMRVFKALDCRGTCVLQGNVYGVTQMSAYCKDDITGYVLWG